MKWIIILLFGVVGAQDCFPTYNSNSETMPCIGLINETPFVADKDVCNDDDFSHCCMFNGECVIGSPTESQINASVSKDEKDELWKGAKKAVENATMESEKSEATMLRSLISPLIPPGLIKKCIPPVPFPGNCNPKRDEPYVLEPPINIPYCLRIPCNHLKKNMYEKSQRACGMQPGCYFDKELFEYREAFGDSVLPGVPVCHLAIRNKFFQVKARDVVIKYGSWNPYFTNCLLNEFNDEILKGPNGCELLPILDAFYVTPKLAGWKNINSYECALIDGCWRKGRGCFYPVDIHSVRIKSGQKQILYGNKEIIFGRPKCQHFDTSSPLNILKSYHRCLSAGCSIDPCVTYIYFNLLYDVGTVLTVDKHWNYWGDVEKGLVGAFNLERIIGEYGFYDSLNKPSTTATPKTRPYTLTSPTTNPFDFPFPSRQGRSINVLPPGKPSHQPSCGYTPSPKVEPCGFAHRIYGARPCAPPIFRPPHSNSYCPYKPFSVPRFPTLKGRFDGCCDINLCYLSKLEISKMHSGPSHYYSEWSLFSVCSASCEGGFRKRTRKCISDDRKLCTERLEDTQPCNTQKCCSWSDWGDWTPCPSTCEPGIQRRTRECTPQKCFCPGDGEDIRPCKWTYCDG